MRFGIALALLLSVIVALYVGPAFRQFADQLGGHISGRPDDFKTSHSTRLAEGE